MALGCVGFFLNIAFYFLIYPLAKFKKPSLSKVEVVKKDRHSEKNKAPFSRQSPSFLVTEEETTVVRRKNAYIPNMEAISSKDLSKYNKSLNLQVLCFHLALDSISSLLLIISASLVLFSNSKWGIFLEHHIFTLENQHRVLFLAEKMCNQTRELINETDIDIETTMQQQCSSYCEDSSHWTDYIDATLSLVQAGFILYGSFEHSKFPRPFSSIFICIFQTSCIPNLHTQICYHFPSNILI